MRFQVESVTRRGWSAEAGVGGGADKADCEGSGRTGSSAFPALCCSTTTMVRLATSTLDDGRRGNTKPPNGRPVAALNEALCVANERERVDDKGRRSVGGIRAIMVGCELSPGVVWKNRLELISTLVLAVVESQTCL